MGTEVITYSRIGKEDIRFGKGTFEVVLADGRKVVLNEVDIGAVLNDASLSSPAFSGWLDTSTYGASPTAGAGTNYQAIQNAIDDAADQGFGHVLLRGGTHVVNQAFTNIGPNTTFHGLAGAVLSKEFNGDLFDTGSSNYVKFHDLQVLANGNTYTGNVVVFGANSQHGEWRGGRVLEGADSIFYYEIDGGYQSNILGGVYGLSSANLTAGAVVKNQGVDTLAMPRHWSHCDTLALTWWYKGTGMGSFFAVDVYSAGFDFTSDTSIGCSLVMCRLAIPAGQTARMNGNTIDVSLCKIGGNLTVESGYVYGHFVNNTMDPAFTFTDSSPKFGVASGPQVEDPRLATGMQVLVLDTANLPAAATAMDGRMIIENAGAGNRNLILYAGGERFRIDGGANV